MHVAFRKITKKHDKITGQCTMQYWIDAAASAYFVTSKDVDAVIPAIG
jgi:SPX domain protein involved in polyphosphate accumulation